MKKILAAVLVATSIAAHAESLHAPNEAGGSIVITDRPCPTSEKLRYAYAVEGNGAVTAGCWTFFDGLVHILWTESNIHMAYPPEAFMRSSKRRKADEL